MIKNIAAKIKAKSNEQGLTFVEMLVALLIVVMVAAIVATGVPAGFKAYRNAVDGSNAQVALSTTASKLRDELSYATDVTTDATGKVLYYQTEEGYWASIAESADHKSLVRHLYMGDDVSSMQEISDSPRPLLQDAAITEHLSIGFSDDTPNGIYYDNGIFNVYGLEVYWEDNEDKPVLKAGEGSNNCYKIRSLSISE